MAMSNCADRLCSYWRDRRTLVRLSITRYASLLRIIAASLGQRYLETVLGILE